MTLTDLARAAGVQPGNLRRMLASTAASPRLGSVMRLLPPLHGRIAPAGARTAAELAAYLDDQRRHQNLDWEQLHDQLGAGADKIAATFLSEPEKLSLPVVMRLADALHVELSLVDDEAQGVRDGRTKRRPPASPRRPAPRSRTVNPASPSPPTAPPPASPPVLEVTAPASSWRSATASSTPASPPAARSHGRSSATSPTRSPASTACPTCVCVRPWRCHAARPSWPPVPASGPPRSPSRMHPRIRPPGHCRSCTPTSCVRRPPLA